MQNIYPKMKQNQPRTVCVKWWVVVAVVIVVIVVIVVTVVVVVDIHVIVVYSQPFLLNDTLYNIIKCSNM